MLFDEYPIFPDNYNCILRYITISHLISNMKFVKYTILNNHLTLNTSHAKKSNHFSVCIEITTKKVTTFKNRLFLVGDSFKMNIIS